MPILESHRQLVNDAILSLGIKPEICQQDSNPNLWKLHRGTAQIIIVAQESTTHLEDKVATISMMSPILQIPQDFKQTTALQQFILESNHQLITESFSISNRWLILSTTYYLDDMRRQEVIQMLDTLSFHAQSFIRIIDEKFGINQST
ncbi:MULTISPECIES: YbjN domain-containing protein [unclassified Aureispira]|uniref:YbjN domain-containing protein n=1 Tax=unclassified Aureispira TaxID=2649989 RepID=UPI000698B663|nr:MULTISPECIES: YbjN domain-containing protein [unclassified Aureispira]WMX16597.1 YbjN domain-containing protein [Aureispira sp. CCB-E]